MGRLTHQRKRAPKNSAVSGGPVWKRIVLGALATAALAWSISAERAVKASGAPTVPMSYSFAVVRVPPVASSPEALELARLKTRNRRLEALVSVLRARSESRK
jgi:hypothetical protein